MNKKNFFACYAVCLAMLCAALSGCNSVSEGTTSSADANSSVSVTEENDSDVMTDNLADDLVINTEFGDLHYPDQWREYIITEQEQTDESITVTFKMESDGSEHVLFKVIIGICDDNSDIIGSLSGSDGTQRNVYLQVNSSSEDSGLSEEEQNRFYAMQEDLNYLIDNLK